MYNRSSVGKHMNVSINEVVSISDSVKKYEIVSELTQIDIYGVSYELSIQPFTLQLKMIGLKKIVVSGETQVAVKATCDRCLNDTDVSLDLVIEETADVAEGIFVPDEDLSPYLEDKLIDVDGLLSEQILLGWPSKVLCNEDCKGLCPVCGCNLNETTCNCDTRVIDPRMAQLLDFEF